MPFPISYVNVFSIVSKKIEMFYFLKRIVLMIERLSIVLYGLLADPEASSLYIHMPLFLNTLA